MTCWHTADFGDDELLHLYDLISALGVVSRPGSVITAVRSLVPRVVLAKVNSVHSPAQVSKDFVDHEQTEHYCGTRHRSLIHNTSPCTTIRPQGHSNTLLTPFRATSPNSNLQKY